MAWVSIVEADLLTVIDHEELDGYRERATTDEGVDPVGALIQRAVQGCRGHIRANRDNTLAPGDTLPEEVVEHCLIIIRHRVLTILKQPIGEDRRNDYKVANDFFRDVAKGLITIAQPEEAAPEIAPPRPSPRYNRPCKTNRHGI